MTSNQQVTSSERPAGGEDSALLDSMSEAVGLCLGWRSFSSCPAAASFLLQLLAQRCPSQQDLPGPSYLKLETTLAHTHTHTPDIPCLFFHSPTF